MKTPSQPTVASGETRRTFIKRTATLAALASTPAILRTPVYGQNQAPSANVTGANNRIVMGVIGTGKQGTAHLKMFKANGAEWNASVGAVCDVYQKHLYSAKKFIGLEDKDAIAIIAVCSNESIDAILITAVDNRYVPH
jgi:hypothetical protein